MVKKTIQKTFLISVLTNIFLLIFQIIATILLALNKLGKIENIYKSNVFFGLIAIIIITLFSIPWFHHKKWYRKLVLNNIPLTEKQNEIGFDFVRQYGKTNDEKSGFLEYTKLKQTYIIYHTFANLAYSLITAIVFATI